MNFRLLNTLKKFLPLIGIIIFIYLIYSLDIKEIGNAFLLINPLFLACSLLLTIPRIFIRNSAWQLIQKEQKITIPFFTSLKIFLIGYFYGTITPGYIGQLMRVPYMKEETEEPYGKLFVNTMIETIIHTLTLYGMMFFGALLVISTLPSLFILTVTWVSILGIILFFFLKKERGEKFFFTLVYYLTPHSIKKYLHQFVDTFYFDFPQIKRLIVPLLLGLCTWIIIFTQNYLIVFGMGLDIPYFSFLLLFPVANVAGFIPISFAGLGTRELTAVFLFSTIFAIPEAQVFVFSLVGFIITDVITGFIGFICASTTNLRKATFFGNHS